MGARVREETKGRYAHSALNAACPRPELAVSGRLLFPQGVQPTRLPPPVAGHLQRGRLRVAVAFSSVLSAKIVCFQSCIIHIGGELYLQKVHNRIHSRESETETTRDKAQRDGFNLQNTVVISRTYHIWVSVNI